MKNLSFFQKILYLLNIIVALALFIGFLVPYFGEYLSVLSLTSIVFPFLILLNILFVFYWLYHLKKQVFLSGLLLLLNYYNIQAIYQYGNNTQKDENAFSLMSYNVRLFNAYQWIKKKSVDVDISNYIKDLKPDILLLQEYKNDAKTDFSQYKYKHIVLKGNKHKAGLAIFSKYNIINTGNFNFKDTYNNAIWSDILINSDTLRVYNVHLQSYRIVDPKDLVEQDKTKVRDKLIKVFDKQVVQAQLIANHIQKNKYTSLIGGDFNNTAFSRAYRLLANQKNDAFVKAGKGFGFSWKYKNIPMRIDFILTQKNIEVLEFNTSDQLELSDHYPIKAILKIKNK